MCSINNSICFTPWIFRSCGAPPFLKTRLAMRSVNPLRWVTIPCGRREAATGFGRDLHRYFGGCLKPPWEPQCGKIIYGKFILYGGEACKPCTKKTFWNTLFLVHTYGTSLMWKQAPNQQQWHWGVSDQKNALFSQESSYISVATIPMTLTFHPWTPVTGVVGSYWSMP